MKPYTLVSLNRELNNFSLTVIHKSTLGGIIFRGVSAYNVLESGKIDGLRVVGSNLVCDVGRLEDYYYNSNKLVVLYRLDDGYIMANRDANVAVLSTQKALELVKIFGLANGRLLYKNDKFYIKGKFRYLSNLDLSRIYIGKEYPRDFSLYEKLKIV